MTPERAEIYRRLAAQDRSEVLAYALAVSDAIKRGEGPPTSAEWDARRERDMNVVKNTKNRFANLHKKTDKHELLVAAYSCKPPCVCDGFEVCLHHIHPHGRSPIWPVFNAASEQEAQEIQARLVRFAASIDPEALRRGYPREGDFLTPLLEAWARLHGWTKTHHIVWRRETGKEGA